MKHFTRGLHMLAAAVGLALIGAGMSPNAASAQTPVNSAQKQAPPLHATEYHQKHAAEEVDIRLVPHFPHRAAERRLRALGAEIIESSDYFHRISVRIKSKRLAKKLRARSPRWIFDIQPRPIPALDNDSSRASIGVPSLQAPPWGLPNPYNLTGAGVRIGIWDGGQPGMPVVLGVVNTPVHADLIGGWIPEEAVLAFLENEPHATHVAGTAAGDGSASVSQGGSPLQWAGMAPEAYVHTWQMGGAEIEMLNSVLGLAPSGLPIHLSSNSWGYIGASQCPQIFGSYMFQCGDVDKLVWDKKLPIFVSAGNSQTSIAGGFGTVKPLGTAKNVVTVGAVTKADAMTGFSSWGPTLDGRLKPDAVAVGLGVNSLGVTGSNDYVTMLGTSMAAPAVSGLGALLIEQYRLIAGSDPDPALLKAVLLNSATDLGNAGPDFKFGYGKINALKSARTLQDGDYLYNGTGLSSGATQTHALNVTGCANDLKVLLAWSDREFPGSGCSDPTLINDLDLVLVDPNGVPHLPLTLDPTLGFENKVAVAMPNHRDNVEQVVVSGAAPGLWTIEVSGFNVPQGPQSYALTWREDAFLLYTVTDANELAAVGVGDGCCSPTVIGETKDASGTLRRIRGLAYDGAADIMYGMTREGDLVKVDRSTAETTLLLSLASGGPGEFWGGLTFDEVNKRLYSVNAFGAHELVAIQLPGLTETLIGSTTYVPTGFMPQILGLDFYPSSAPCCPTTTFNGQHPVTSGVLYASNRNNDNIVVVDTVDPVADVKFDMGNATIGVNNVQQIAFHPVTGELFAIHDHFSTSNNAALSKYNFTTVLATELCELPFGIVENAGGGNDTYGWGGLAFAPRP